MAFRETADGRIDRMYLNVVGDHLALERVGFRERASTVLISVGVACTVLIVAGVLAGVAALWRRWRQGTFRPASGSLIALASVALAATIVATVVATYFAFVPLTRFLYGPSPALWTALTGTNLAALLAIVMIVLVGRRLFGRTTRPLGRAGSLLLAGACIVLVVFLVQFNLVGYRL